MSADSAKGDWSDIVALTEAGKSYLESARLDGHELDDDDMALIEASGGAGESLEEQITLLIKKLSTPDG